jgi:adenosylmethionine-8-amino-7-oxononanoate aminotransferase
MARMNSFFARNLKRAYPQVESAEGSWIRDTAGKTYLDGCSGAVSANLGHGLPEVKSAINAQLEKVAFAHTSQFVSEPALALADRLVKLAPASFHGGRVYFSCGGSEAVETALKLARAYYCERDGESTRTVYISRWNSYHGSTFGTLAITGHPARRRPYYSLLREQPHIAPAYPYRCPCGFGPGACQSIQCSLARANELETEIERVGKDNVVAFIAEPIVGAALGAVGPVGSYWQRIREICTKHDILFIADEVMTGLGRTGKNFALDRWNVEPDIIVVGKGLAAGYMPLAAVIASPKVVAPFLDESSSGAFEHGFTYSGHPLACSAGLAVVDYMQSHGVISAVASREDDFSMRMEALRQFDFVGDVRAYGFMGGIEFVAKRATKEPFKAEAKVHKLVADEAMKAGLIVYPGAGFLEGGRGDHIMVAPPLNISDADMDTLFVRLAQVFSAVSKPLHAACG